MRACRAAAIQAADAENAAAVSGAEYLEIGVLDEE